MKRFGSIVLIVLGLTGCGGQSGDVLGLSRSVPDEFAVVSRQSLRVPPDFALRPPGATERGSQIALVNSQAEARKALLGALATPQTSLDAEDQTFLQRAGADKALPDIRRIVDAESTDLIRAERTFVRELLSLILDEEPPGKVLDPVSAEREVKQRVLSDGRESAEPQAVIERNADRGFDWESLWPF